MRGRLIAAVLLLSTALACHRTPAPVLPSPPPQHQTQPSTLDALRRHVNALLATPGAGAGTWGIAVRSLATGEALLAVNAHTLLTPASTLKLFTLATAADVMGWEHRYVTRVMPLGDVRDGVLEGDLVVEGSGDPSLEDWDGSARAMFAAWAGELKARGITAIGGRIVGDGRVFADSGVGAGWMWDDLQAGYSALASGLQFNEGVAQVVVEPGAAEGAPAALRVSPAYARVPLVNDVRTGGPGSANDIEVAAVPFAAGGRVAGHIALDSARQTRTISVGNSSQYFLDALRDGLVANGIEVRGPVVDASVLGDARSFPVGAPQLTPHMSEPLSTLAVTLMTLSQNLYAETFLRTVGFMRGVWGTADTGLAAERERLTSWGIPPSEVVLADGSGLSRYNLATASAEVDLLAHVWSDERLREPFVAALPVAGRAGTLAGRMAGTAAEGRVQAKTGSFTHARGVAGFVHSAEEEPLAFSVLVNNYGVRSADVDRVTDAIIVALAEFRR